MRGLIVDVMHWNATIDGEVPDRALTLRILNQESLEDVCNDIAYPVRSNTCRDKLHFFNVSHTALLQRGRAKESLDDQPRQVRTYSRTPPALLRVTETYFSHLRKVEDTLCLNVCTAPQGIDSSVEHSNQNLMEFSVFGVAALEKKERVDPEGHVHAYARDHKIDLVLRDVGEQRSVWIGTHESNPPSGSSSDRYSVSSIRSSRSKSNEDTPPESNEGPIGPEKADRFVESK